MSHSDLWNNLPDAERSRLHPFLIETHILHLEQTRQKIVRAHKELLADIDAQITNLRKSLSSAELIVKTYS